MHLHAFYAVTMHVGGKRYPTESQTRAVMRDTAASSLHLVVVALLRAAVDLVILHQFLGQGDASQQILDEVLDANFPARLLPSRRLQKLLDGYHLPGRRTKTHVSAALQQVSGSPHY